MSVADLTKQLISCPSYDDGNRYESPLVTFLLSYISEHLPWMTVETQDVAPNRQNIFFHDGSPTELLIINHLDTVIPSDSWIRDPFVASVEDGKLYGLGSSDTKGNIAALLSALISTGPTKGVAVLLYADEEYHFAGMKHFISSDLAGTLSPSQVFSVDGSGLSLGLGCRGLLEFSVHMETASEHSARKSVPTLYEQFSAITADITSYLSTCLDDVLGTPTMNVAKLLLGSKDQQGAWLHSANKTPQVLDALIDIRTTPATDVDTVMKRIRDGMHEATRHSISIVHNEPGYSTSSTLVSPYIEAMSAAGVTPSFLNPSTFGYLDIAMLRDVYPDALFCSFGAGDPGQAHRADEYISVANLEAAVLYHTDILLPYKQ